MFKNLKRKLLITYILTIFTLIFVSFVIIFYSSYKTSMNDISFQLDTKDMDDAPYNDTIEHKEQESLIKDNDDFQIIGRDMYLELDSQGHIIDYMSQKTISEKNLLLIEEELKEGDSYFQIDDKYFAFNINNNSNIVKVIDVTQTYNSLRKLLINLIVIGLTLLIILAIFGNYFVTKTLMPIKETYEKQKNFVSDASHELKTPLAVISSCLDLIKDKDDESEKWLEYCITETKRLSMLTSNLLTLSKEETIIDFSKYEPINMSKHLDLMLCAYEAKMFEEKINFDYSLTDDIYVKINKEDLAQIIHILIDNAIKYNDNRRKIKVSLIQEHKYALLEIKNTSEHLSEDVIKKLFDRFYRNDYSRNKKTEGFGLGLAIVSNIFKKYKIKYNVTYKDSYFDFTIKIPIEHNLKK